MKQAEKKEFKINNMGLYKISTIFGIKGNPVGNHKVHLELGRKIYGDRHDSLQVFILNKLKQKIIQKIPTPEEWAKMTAIEKSKFKITNIGLYKISTIFNTKGDPVHSHKIHLKLGRKIYGNRYKCLQQTELTLEKLKQKILEKIPTPEDWVLMKWRKKQKIRIADMSLRKIATSFNVKGHPRDNYSAYMELGRKIYGSKHECLQERTPENIRKQILKEVPTLEEWSKMKQMERKIFKVARMGLVGISTIFGVSRNPKDSHAAHMELGKRIYGNKSDKSKNH
ncbi:hypothetical protein KJ742_04480 [Patescibacteria group bacterium]|nr:hypothetical protein [Patescibacteria group bacterium]